MGNETTDRHQARRQVDSVPMASRRSGYGSTDMAAAWPAAPDKGGSVSEISYSLASVLIGVKCVSAAPLAYRRNVRDGADEDDFLRGFRLGTLAARAGRVKGSPILRGSESHWRPDVPGVCSKIRTHDQNARLTRQLRRKTLVIDVVSTATYRTPIQGPPRNNVSRPLGFGRTDM